ncbi:histidine phosphatase family protein [Shewanella yunxiaonensis]|uniref:Histidine phosphatase family protein n=1 Tax=Shewanella yunxiaonensis TaxID=2829809 RepID=A0ABX7YUL9_9GAMM|nr:MULTISPECIES: histidine phosphatase family protein [Shewanella]MDF0533099.1 histidine phosphatase family protein [Shewanella sp. A32]QUN06402.1 histidine phosphatase family protein [Shewanella yunxiaonensis]
MSCYRKLTVYLMRHGSCADGDILRGRTESPLSEQGEAEMWNAWRELCEHLPEGKLLLLSSPLQRCSQFADGLASEMPEFFDSPLQTADWLQELNFGEWDGKSYASLQADYPKATAAYQADPLNHTPPAGETVRELYRRVTRGWESLIQELLHGEQHTALLITHGGVMRTLISEMLNPGELPLNGVFNGLELPYGSVLKIEVDAHEVDGEWECQPKLHWQL